MRRIHIGRRTHDYLLLLGHENINTTMRYIDLDDREVKNNLLKYA